MSVTAPAARPGMAIEPVRVPWPAWLAVAVGLLAVYLVTQENGVLLTSSWETLHELFHDGRHALGVPCH